jgi:hypothetical protein
MQTCNANDMLTYHAVKTYVEVEVKILALPTSVVVSEDFPLCVHVIRLT